jgi:RNA polymerase sigma factor (sigma-70 family)
MHDERTESREGRVVALEAIIVEYEAPLLRYAGRILRDSHAAQDVVQNAFLRLLKTWAGEWMPSAQISVWLYRVVHNCAVDYIRTESRRELLHLRHAENEPEAVPPDLGRGSDVTDEALRAVEMLRGLDLREQQLVILKVFEDKSYKEISEITGLSVSNVGYILHFAMKRMAAGMAGRRDEGNAAETARES